MAGSRRITHLRPRALLLALLVAASTLVWVRADAAERTSEAEAVLATHGLADNRGIFDSIGSIFGGGSASASVSTSGKASASASSSGGGFFDSVVNVVKKGVEIGKKVVDTVSNVIKKGTEIVKKVAPVISKVTTALGITKPKATVTATAQVKAPVKVTVQVKAQQQAPPKAPWVYQPLPVKQPKKIPILKQPAPPKKPKLIRPPAKPRPRPNQREFYEGWTCCRICPQHEVFPDIDTMFGDVPDGKPGTIPVPPLVVAGPEESTAQASFLEEEAYMSARATAGEEQQFIDFLNKVGNSISNVANKVSSTVTKVANKVSAAVDKVQDFLGIKKQPQPQQPQTQQPQTQQPAKQPVEHTQPKAEPDVDPNGKNDVEIWGCCNICPSMSTPFLSAAAEISFLQEREKNGEVYDSGRPSRPNPLLGLPPCCNFCREKYFTSNVYKETVRLPEEMKASPEGESSESSFAELKSQHWRTVRDSLAPLDPESILNDASTVPSHITEHPEGLEEQVGSADLDLMSGDPTRFTSRGFFDSIGSAVSGAVKSVSNAVSSVVSGVKSVVNNVAAKAKSVVASVQQTASKVYNALPSPVKDLVNKIPGATKVISVITGNKQKVEQQKPAPKPVPTAPNKGLELPTNVAPLPPPAEDESPEFDGAEPPKPCCHRCRRLSAEVNGRNQFFWPEKNVHLDPDSYLTQT